MILFDPSGIRTRTAGVDQSEDRVSHELHDPRIKVPSPAKEESYIFNVKTSPGAHPAP